MKQNSEQEKKKSNRDYDKVRKEKLEALRAQRKEEKRIQRETGDKLHRNLGFITHIFTQLGYTAASFAEKCGMNSQMMYWYLGLKDDCVLSKAQEMLEHINIDLDYTLEKKRTAGNIVQNIIDVSSETEKIRGILPSSMRFTEAASVTAPLFERSVNKKGRLEKIAKIIVDEGLNAKQVCDLIDSDGATIIQWFDVKDDMRISKMNELAEALGYDLIWVVKPKA